MCSSEPINILRLLQLIQCFRNTPHVFANNSAPAAENEFSPTVYLDDVSARSSNGEGSTDWETLTFYTVEPNIRD